MTPPALGDQETPHSPLGDTRRAAHVGRTAALPLLLTVARGVAAHEARLT